MAAGSERGGGLPLRPPGREATVGGIRTYSDSMAPRFTTVIGPPRAEPACPSAPFFFDGPDAGPASPPRTAGGASDGYRPGDRLFADPRRLQADRRAGAAARYLAE